MRAVGGTPMLGGSDSGRGGMDFSTLLLAGAAGTALLAMGATAWTLAARRGGAVGDAATGVGVRSGAVEAAAEAFDIALVELRKGGARLVAGEESLAQCAERLGADRLGAA